MRIIGYIGMLALLAIAMGDVTLFVNIPSLVLVVGFAFWGFLASAGCATGPALRAAFSRGADEPTALRTGLSAIRASRRAALAGGIVAAAAGLVLMCSKIQDPSAIGPGMAMVLLGFLGALVVAYVLLLPLQADIERRMHTAGMADGVLAETTMDLAVVAAVWVIPVLAFGLMLASFKLQG